MRKTGVVFLVLMWGVLIDRTANAQDKALVEHGIKVGPHLVSGRVPGGK